LLAGQITDGDGGGDAGDYRALDIRGPPGAKIPPLQTPKSRLYCAEFGASGAGFLYLPTGITN